MDHVKQLVTTFAILVESTHLMRKWQKLYESVRKLDSIMITWQHSTSGPVSELDSDTNLIHNSQINKLTNMLVLLSDDTWIDFCITCDDARHSSVYRWWPMFQSYTDCNVVKRNIQPGKNTPNQSVFADGVMNIRRFTEQHFISYGPFHSMHHYVDCTELHYGTCHHTSWNTYNVLITPTIRALQKIGWCIDAMRGILLANCRHQHPK